MRSDYIYLLLLLFTISACVNHDYSKEGNISTYDVGNKKAFSFVVTNDFFSKIPKNDYNSSSKISKSEVRLLKKLLKQNEYCFNKNGELSFVITSRQDKVYDITFSNLIVQSYNARPLTPITYFGECVF